MDSITLIFILFCCVLTYPAMAEASALEINGSDAIDLHKTIGKDLVNLVDKEKYEVEGLPYYNAIWSPNGNEVLINSFISAYPPKKPAIGGFFSLYIAKSNGTEINQIVHSKAPTNTGGIAIVAPAWSCSGNYFAYLEQIQGKRKETISLRTCILNKDLQVIRVVQHAARGDIMNYYGDDIRWSPTEDKMACIINGSLIVFGPNQEDIIISSSAKNPTWSPDGTKIAFFETNNGAQTLKIYDIKNGKQILSSDQIYSKILWSPDSEKLLFFVNTNITNLDCVTGICAIDINSGEVVLIQGSISFVPVPRWGNNSQSIFVSKTYTNTSTNDLEYTLYSCTMEGKAQKIISSTREFDFLISSDNHPIVLIQNPFNRSYIKKYELHLFTDLENQCIIKDVSDWKLNGNNLTFMFDDKIVLLNTSTHVTSCAKIPLGADKTFSINPTNHFVLIGNMLMELKYHTVDFEQMDHATLSSIDSEMNYSTNKGVTTGIVVDIDEPIAKEQNVARDVRLTGFTVVLSFIGLLAASVLRVLKKD